MTMKNSEMNRKRIYAAIDLKSFYASVECSERGLNPLTANLVVADRSRTEKTICLAVSPSLKAIGIPGRARLFEVTQKVKLHNAQRLQRLRKMGISDFEGKSCDSEELAARPELELDFIAAKPRMKHYMNYSAQIYNIYLKYIAPEDIHVYSIDEVFIDVTEYLDTYGMTAAELVQTMIRDVLKVTGITATAGIGPNLYLAKIAMDIVAKHIEADEDGVRIAELDERSYREKLWGHKPITDFWRVGRGYAAKLRKIGVLTMGDVARCSVENEEILYKLFGVNAELLIDHAWGWEPCTIAQIKAYKPMDNSIGEGQVLHCAYTAAKGKLIMKEMMDKLILKLVEKGLVTDHIILTVGYDMENLEIPEIRENYRGEITKDWYGRLVPKHAHGSVTLERPTSSTRIIMEEAEKLYDRIVDPILLVRRLTVAAGRVLSEQEAEEKKEIFEQMDLFTDYEALEKERASRKAEQDREKRMQKAVLDIRRRFGSNAIVKGMNLEEGATAIERNSQIGGHNA